MDREDDHVWILQSEKHSFVNHYMDCKAASKNYISTQKNVKGLFKMELQGICIEH